MDDAPEHAAAAERVRDFLYLYDRTGTTDTIIRGVRHGQMSATLAAADLHTLLDALDEVAGEHLYRNP